MSRVTIELDPSRERRLRAAAQRANKTEEDICREALDSYLGGAVADGEPAGEDAYLPLRNMIGLVREGRADGSVVHDVRPDDPL